MDMAYQGVSSAEPSGYRRFFFANARLRRYAHKEAHKTPGGPVVRYRRLPPRKGVRKR